MVNVNCKGKCHPKSYIKRVSYPKERENIKGNESWLNSSTTLSHEWPHVAFPYFGVPLHRVPQVAFNLGTVGVRLASHLQTIRGFRTNDLNTVRGKKLLEVSANHPEKSQPVVGFLSLRRTEWVVEWSQAERHEHRLHPQRGSGGQRACWRRWPPAPPVAGPTERTPARHLHLWRGKEIWKQLFNTLGGSTWHSSMFILPQLHDWNILVRFSINLITVTSVTGN